MPQFHNSDIVLLVTGLVGSGRSTFINALLDEEKMPVGDALRTCTKEVNYTVIDLQNMPQCKRDYRLVVVDTPGFDDPDKTDAEVLQQILVWLGTAFSDGKCRGGVIYLHDISEDRYQGVAEYDLKALDRSLNPGLYSQLIIATTKWNRISPGEGLRRHNLSKAHWARVLNAGSKLYEYRTKEDAWKIVSSFLPSLEQGQELDVGRGLSRLQSHQKQYHRSPPEALSKVLDRVVGILGLFGSSLVRKPRLFDTESQ